MEMAGGAERSGGDRSVGAERRSVGDKSGGAEGRSVGDRSGGAERRSSFQFLLNRPLILGHYLKPGSLAKSIFKSATDKNLIMEIGRARCFAKL